MMKNACLVSFFLLNIAFGAPMQNPDMAGTSEITPYYDEVAEPSIASSLREITETPAIIPANRVNTNVPPVLSRKSPPKEYRGSPEFYELPEDFLVQMGPGPSDIEPVFPLPDDGKKILVLELNYVLVHAKNASASFKPPSKLSRFLTCAACEMPLESFHVLVNSQYYIVYKRPYVDAFLQDLSGNFHLVLWTASGREYAEKVLKKSGIGRFFPAERRFYADFGKKDLTKLGYDLREVILLDNAESLFVSQTLRIPFRGGVHLCPTNGIAVRKMLYAGDWHSDAFYWNDNKALLNVLDSLIDVEDVRLLILAKGLRYANYKLGLKD